MSTELQDHAITLRGHRVRYTEAGRGPPLLLVHGFLVSHKEWRPVLPELARHFRCIAPDLPGFGASDKPAPERFAYTRESYAEIAVELLRALDISQARVCGHSMGGAVALTLAADYPDMFDRLIAIDSACFPFSMPLKGRLPLLPLVGELIFKKLYRRPVFRDYFKNEVFSGYPGLDLDRVDEYYTDFSSREGRDAAYAVLHRAVVDLQSLQPKIPRIQAPTLVMWGEQDRIFPVHLAHRLVRAIPEADLHVVPGCGHAPNEQKPDETVAAILDHAGVADPRVEATGRRRSRGDAKGH